MARSRRARCWLPGRYVLVIAEKPKAARRIAEYIADGNRPLRCSMGGVPFWVLRRSDGYYVVGSAAGHLYGLTTDERGFPVFSYYWAPLWEIDPGARYTKKYLDVLSLLAKRAVLFINACDYDIEGSVIGFLVIRFLGDPGRARRAKFSALTPGDIRRAFSSLEPLDWDMIEAGLARHELDWLWGINVSRALMEAVKKASRRRVVLSAGRVQSPTLREAVERTKHRNLFVPLPYFTVYVLVELGPGIRKRIAVVTTETRGEALSVARTIRAKPEALVVSVEVSRREVPPPPPFNLGDLQTEAARIYGYDPHYTQSVAEQLYLDGLISYPRTNSQKIPPTIDVVSILRQLVHLEPYAPIIEHILRVSRGKPRPRNGVKDDPAHPAIHPTGILPGRLDKPAQRIYDLVVRRFLASMMGSAIVSKNKATLLISGTYRVELSGGYVEDEGWFRAYPFLRPRLEELPPLRRGDKLRVLRVEVRSSLQKAPELHTKLSLVRWMESSGIGTEATRARIVKLLFDRGYLAESRKRVYATDLGLAVAEILERYFPQLVSVELTRHFEQLLSNIRLGRTRRSKVVEEAKQFLDKILRDFRDTYMDEAGAELAKALGFVKPGRKCLVCDREAYREGLCRYHYDAYNLLVKGYEEWRRRLDGISFRSYVERLARSSSTGSWVRDVARAIIEGRVRPGLSYEEN